VFTDSQSGTAGSAGRHACRAACTARICCSRSVMR
jgi:hypothetical protein